MPVNVLIAVGIVGMLLLAVSVIFFVVFHQRRAFQFRLARLRSEQLHEQQLRQSTQDAQEQTLSHVALELHDDIGVLLSTVKLFLAKAHEQHDAQLIAHARELLEESIGKIRTMSHQLHPASLQRLGLAEAIDSMLRLIDKAGVIRCTLTPGSTTARMPEAIELSLYRIVQELVNNLIKHGAVHNIQTLVRQAGDRVVICITHDGRGLVQAAYQERLERRGALGLKSIANRLQLLRGAICFEQLPDGHYSITIESPAA